MSVVTLGRSTDPSVDQLLGQFGKYESSHALLRSYYEGPQRVKHLNIAIPQHLAAMVDTVIGWSGTVVDVIEERLDFLGWDGDDWLQQFYADNRIGVESGMGHLDSLIYGIAYPVVSKGRESEGEPEVLFTMESATTLTGTWDRRSHRITRAISRHKSDEELEFYDRCILYFPDTTVRFRRSFDGGQWLQDGPPDNHRLGRVTVGRLGNRAWAGRRSGRSEITKALRTYTDMGIRTLLGMEVNREFYSAPQRYALGAKEDAFQDENGNPIPAWQALMSQVWALERDPEGVMEGGDGLPQVGEFSPQSPEPFLSQLEGITKLVSAEGGIPPMYLGFDSNNPPSADAIRAMEARLVKRSERRISGWSEEYVDVAMFAQMIRDPKAKFDRSKYSALWRDPATPTKAADADRAVKLIQAGVLAPDSPVTFEMVGLTPDQARREKAHQDKVGFMKALQNPAPEEGTEVNPDGGADGSAQPTEPPAADAGQPGVEGSGKP